MPYDYRRVCVSAFVSIVSGARAPQATKDVTVKAADKGCVQLRGPDPPTISTLSVGASDAQRCACDRRAILP